MIKAIKLLFVLAVFFCAVPAHATFTQVQKVSGNCNSSGPCSLTVASTGSGHLLVMAVGAINGAGGDISSVSGGGTWTVDTGCHVNNSGGTFGLVSCAYSLSSTSGTTSVSLNFTGTNNYRFVFFEYSFTGSSVSFDQSSSVSNLSGSTTQSGVALTLSGTNDIIFQITEAIASGVTSISAPYTIENTDTASGSSVSVADSLNTTSGATPTWTFPSSVAMIGGAIAFKEISAAAHPAGHPIVF